MKRLVLYIWSAPWGVVGLLLEDLVRAVGWKGPGYLERHTVVVGPLADWMHGRGWAAVTIGWSRFYWSPPTATTVRHEARHVEQGMRWGILFPFAYLTLLAIYGYQRHPFEVDARRSEGAVSE